MDKISDMNVSEKPTIKHKAAKHLFTFGLSEYTNYSKHNNLKKIIYHQKSHISQNKYIPKTRTYKLKLHPSLAYLCIDSDKLTTKCPIANKQQLI